MAINDKNRTFDGFSNLIAGVDDGRKPNLIDKNQCVKAENAVFRGGETTTRPPFIAQTFEFENPALFYDAFGTFFADPGPYDQGSANFFTKRFQEASYYAPTRGKECLMVSIGGRLYQVTPKPNNTMHVYEIALPRRNRNTIPISYHLQAGEFHIVQDGESAPIIINGTGARRAGADEIFTGKMMGYGQGRIVLVGNDNLIYFGDIRDGKGNGDADLLGFTETQFLNEGFPSALPSGMGVPTAVQFIPQQDSATGVGECLVFGENGVESFYLSLPRETWKDSAFQHTALLGIGATGHRAVCVVNEDIWFRANDGFRSYRQARAVVNQWAQIPMSTNVSEWVEADTPSLLNYASAINFDKRLIGTCTPVPNEASPDDVLQSGLYHNGLVSLDFDILSTFGKLAAPAWDGHWARNDLNFLDGLRILQLVEGSFNGERRAFAFYITPNNFNGIIEISKNLRDHDSFGVITSKLITRSMDFDQEFNEKTLYGGDFWIDDVQEEVEVTTRYRPDQYPIFTDWSTFTVPPYGVVSQGDANVQTDGFMPRRALPKPADDTDPVMTKRSLRRGYEFQCEIEWAGRATMRKFRMHAQTELEESKAKV